MKKKRVKGQVIETLPNATFKIKTEQGKEILAYLSGKMRFYRIKIVPQDEVIVEISPYDQRRGRIIKRL